MLPCTPELQAVDYHVVLRVMHMAVWHEQSATLSSTER